MAEASDVTAWIAFFTGLYLLAAGAGEFRAPGTWDRMVGEFLASTALTVLAGVVCLALGAAIYLVNPWNAADGLSIAVSVIGGVILAEGLALVAAGDRWIGIARKLLANRSMLWAGVAVALGLGLVLVSAARL